MDEYWGVFLITLAIPYAIMCVVLLAWAMLDRQNPKARARNAVIDFFWCSAAAVGVNFLFVDIPARIVLFVLLTFAGVALRRAFCKWMFL